MSDEVRELPKIIKVKTKRINTTIKVRMMAKHPMESGFRKDETTGEVIPANFLQHLQVTYNSNIVFQAYLGPTISRNPYLSFEFESHEEKGELLITWTENSGVTATEKAVIK